MHALHQLCISFAPMTTLRLGNTVLSIHYALIENKTISSSPARCRVLGVLAKSSKVLCSIFEQLMCL